MRAAGWCAPRVKGINRILVYEVVCSGTGLHEASLVPRAHAITKPFCCGVGRLAGPAGGGGGDAVVSAMGSNAVAFARATGAMRVVVE